MLASEITQTTAYDSQKGFNNDTVENCPSVSDVVYNNNNK